MKLKAKVYRIANRFPDPERQEWVGKPWTWDIVDLDAPIKRLDGEPSMIDWGYHDTWDEALEMALRNLRIMLEVAA